MLNFTPREQLLDSKRRPYFLWDQEMTLEEFEQLLRDPVPEVRAYALGKLMRQAKPDDVFQFASLDLIRELWPALERYLGKQREFWRWLVSSWQAVSESK